MNWEWRPSWSAATTLKTKRGSKRWAFRVTSNMGLTIQVASSKPGKMRKLTSNLGWEPKPCRLGYRESWSRRLQRISCPSWRRRMECSQRWRNLRRSEHSESSMERLVSLGWRRWRRCSKKRKGNSPVRKNELESRCSTFLQTHVTSSFNWVSWVEYKSWWAESKSDVSKLTSTCLWRMTWPFLNEAKLDGAS